MNDLPLFALLILGGIGLILIGWGLRGEMRERAIRAALAVPQWQKDYRTFTGRTYDPSDEAGA